MAKILFFLALALVLVLWFKHQGNKRVGQDKPPSAREPEDMVRCRVCSVNLPRSEAILSKGRFYCCDEHRRRDQ